MICLTPINVAIKLTQFGIASQSPTQRLRRDRWKQVMLAKRVLVKLHRLIPPCSGLWKHWRISATPLSWGGGPSHIDLTKGDRISHTASRHYPAQPITLLSPKSIYLLGTWHVRTMIQSGRFTTIANDTKRYKLSIFSDGVRHDGS